jgi:hypothetical protein
MKFAVLALAGSIGMGISTLASSLHRHNDDESQLYAGAGFFVMLVGDFRHYLSAAARLVDKEKAG